MPSIREMAKGAAVHATEMLIKDASYIPEDKLTWVPMGCAKSAAAILTECAVSNNYLTTAIRGETGERPQAGDWKTHADFQKALKESCKVVCDAIDSLSDEDLNKELTMPWGAKYPGFVAIFLPSQHMNYHDGQINYIQTLLGDSVFHWVE